MQRTNGFYLYSSNPGQNMYSMILTGQHDLNVNIELHHQIRIVARQKFGRVLGYEVNHKWRLYLMKETLESQNFLL